MRGLSIKALAVFAICYFWVSMGTAQEQQKAPSKNVAEVVTPYVRCGALVQPETGKVQRNVLITIQGERIQQIDGAIQLSIIAQHCRHRHRRRVKDQANNEESNHRALTLADDCRSISRCFPHSSALAAV